MNIAKVLLFMSCTAALVPGTSAVWWSLLPNLKDYWSRMWNINLLKARPGDFPAVTPSVWSLANLRPQSSAPFTPPLNKVPQNQVHFGPPITNDVKAVPGGPPIHEHSRPPPQFGPVPNRPNQPPPPHNIQGQIKFPFNIPQENVKTPPRPQVPELGVTVPPSFQWTPIFHPTQPSRSPTTPLPPMPELIPIYPDVLPGAEGQEQDSGSLPMFFVNPAVFEGLVFPAPGLPVDASVISSLPIPSSKPGSTVWHTFENKHNVPGVPGTFHASLSLHYEPDISNEAKPATPLTTRRPSLQSLFKPTRPALKKRTGPTTTPKSTKFNPTTFIPFPLPLTTVKQSQVTDLSIDLPEPLTPLSPSTSATEDFSEDANEMTAETSGDADWTFPDGNQTSSNEPDPSQMAISRATIDPRTKSKPQKRALASWLLAARDGDRNPSGTNCSLRQLLFKRHALIKQQLGERTAVPLANTEKHGIHSNGEVIAKIQTRGSSTDTIFLYRPPKSITTRSSDVMPSLKKLSRTRKLVKTFDLSKREQL